MTAHSVPIANMSDAALAGVAAQGVKGCEAAGLRTILAGAIFLRVRGDDKATANTLLQAIATAVAPSSGVTPKNLATAANYVSKCRAAAKPAHFKWTIDVTQDLGNVLDGLFPEFENFWGAVNRIKASGPDGKPAKTDAQKTEDKAKAKADKELAKTTAMGPHLVEATPQMLLDAVLARLSERNPDTQMPVLENTTLYAAISAFNAELVARAAEIRAEAEMPEAIAA